MRFNVLGPELKRPSNIQQTISRATNPNVVTMGLCAAIVVGALTGGAALEGFGRDRVHDAQARLDRAKAQQGTLLMDRQLLASYLAIAKTYGSVRDSGFTVADALVKVGAAWPDPRRFHVSIKCQTPSQDGREVNLDGVASDYAGLSSTVRDLSRQGYFPIPASGDQHGNQYEFRLEVRR